MTSAGPKHVDRALTAAGETVDEIASESPTGQDLPHGWSWTPGSVQSGGQAPRPANRFRRREHVGSGAALRAGDMDLLAVARN